VTDPYHAKLVRNHVDAIDWSRGKAAFTELKSACNIVKELMKSRGVELIGEKSVETDVKPDLHLTAGNPVTLMGIALTAPAVINYGRSYLGGERKRKIFLVLVMAIYIVAFAVTLPHAFAYDVENSDYVSEP